MRRRKIELIFLFLIFWHTAKQLVEDVIVPFSWSLEYDTCVFQEVIVYRGSDYLVLGIIVNANQLSEARRVIVTNSFGVTKAF